jgi:hypothetical protein
MGDMPVRYCHGCGVYDDHPRRIWATDAANPAGDQLYHYDCFPAEIASDSRLPDDHPAIAATASGKRGQEVRDAMLNSDLVGSEG